MRTSSRRTKPARLSCEVLEDRTTPALAFALSGATPGAGALLAIDTANPAVTASTAITGVSATDTLVGIDFRPQNGLLYGLGVNAATGSTGLGTATLYAISTRTGVATAVGGVGSIALQSGATTTPTPLPLPDPAVAGYGFDFNPTVDRIRVVAGGLNFRVDPNTGLAVDGDTTAAGTNPDGAIGGVGGATSLDAVAYTGNTPNSAATTLLGLDSTTGNLFTVTAPNAGTTALVGSLGVSFARANGFDIAASGQAFAALTANGETALYSINTTTGAATRVGPIGSGVAAVQGFAVQSDAAGTPAVGLSAAGTQLLRFGTTTPGAVTAVTIAGVDAGDALVGIDFRPNTGQLFGLGVNATTGNGTLYRIDPQTGAAAVVGAVGAVDLTIPLPAAPVGYGFNFNPTAAGGDGLIRVVTGSGLNFRINPNTGAAVDGDAATAGVQPDTAISGVTGVTATAYTNSFGQAAGGPTTQYTLDPVGNTLFIQGFNGAGTPAGPNGGVQGNPLPVTLNGVALDFTAVSGFDIPAGVRVNAANTAATGLGFAALTVGGTTSLYSIDLSTGAATNLGPVGNGAAGLSGLTLGDSFGGTVSFTATAVSGIEGNSIAVGLTRTGGTGPQTVTVGVTGGTATPGIDFPAGPYTVTFAEGQTTATLRIPFVNDGITEGPETATLAITGASNGPVGAPAATTLTVTDVPQRFNQAFGTVVGAPVVAVVATGSTTPTLAQPYAGTGIAGGVRVALGDINADGIDDLVTINAVGAPLVKVFSGATGQPLASFQAYPKEVTVPASLAVGDVNGDGFDDIILSTTTTIGAVLVYSGRNFALTGFFAPFGGIPVGFNVAAGDVNSDGFDDIILGTVSGLSAVATFSGRDFSLLGNVFLPFGNLSLGTTVAAGDLDNDGRLDLVVGTNSTAAGVVVFNGRDRTKPAAVFFPFGVRTGGANVAVSDVNGDGLPDIIVGTTDGASNTVALDGRTLAPLNAIAPFGNFPGGAFVA
jgi:hypothetical protein